MVITEGEKLAIIEDARFIYRRYFSDRVPEMQGCLFWAMACKLAIGARGYPHAYVTAGSASFRFRSAEGLTEDEPNMLSYQYEPKGSLREAFTGWLVDGNLPEMHAWVSLLPVSPDCYEEGKHQAHIIDLSFEYQPAQLQRMGLGLKWDADYIPTAPYWEYARKIDREMLLNSPALFLPDAEATQLSSAIIDLFLRTNGLA